MSKYFGEAATLTADASGATLFVPAAILLNPGLLDDPVTASEDKLAIAIVNVLYSLAKNKADDPTWYLASTSVFPGRTSIGPTGSAQTFDTYDISIQARVPSSSTGELPDPDSISAP